MKDKIISVFKMVKKESIHVAREIVDTPKIIVAAQKANAAEEERMNMIRAQQRMEELDAIYGKK